jgi:hypothetical protein
MSTWDVDMTPDSLLNLIPFQKRKAKKQKNERGILQQVDVYVYSHQQV